MIVQPKIDLFDIKNPRLQHIFNKEADDLQKSFEDFRMTSDSKQFKCEIMLCLWFVIHMGASFIQEAQTLYKIDPICATWLESLKTKGKEDIEKWEIDQILKKGGKIPKKDLLISMPSADALSKSQDISRSRDMVNISGEKTDSNKLAKEAVNVEEEDVFGSANMVGEKSAKQSKSSKKEVEKILEDSHDSEDVKEDLGFESARDIEML